MTIKFYCATPGCISEQAVEKETKSFIWIKKIGVTGLTKVNKHAQDKHYSKDYNEAIQCVIDDYRKSIEIHTEHIGRLQSIVDSCRDGIEEMKRMMRSLPETNADRKPKEPMFHESPRG